jgi:ornithine cyclodeaminase/alanine dehydrogenase-like protein (mu-crystallin family)
VYNNVVSEGAETRVMVFGPGFQAKDHHECVSAPSEITRVRIYIYLMPQKLPKTSFNSRIPHAKFAITPLRNADGATTSRRQ